MLIDLSFLDGMGTDDKFRKDVIDIFLANTPPEVEKLNDLVTQKADWDVIYKQAHYLKSSFSVIKINNINELLMKIQVLARKEQDRHEIEHITKELISTFNRALPLLNDMYRNS